MQLGTFSYKLTLITYSVCLLFFFFGAVSEAGDHKVGRDHLRYGHIISIKSRLLFSDKKSFFFRVIK